MLGELGDVSLTTLVVGAASLAILLPLRYLRPKWPRALLVVVLTTAAASLLDLADHGVAVTGNVPTGLFTIGIPEIDAGDIGKLVVGRALGRLRRLLGDAGGVGAAMAAKHSYEISAGPGARSPRESPTAPPGSSAGSSTTAASRRPRWPTPPASARRWRR